MVPASDSAYAKRGLGGGSGSSDVNARGVSEVYSEAEAYASGLVIMRFPIVA